MHCRRCARGRDHLPRSPRLRLGLLRQRVQLVDRAAVTDGYDERPFSTGASVLRQLLFRRRPDVRNGRPGSGRHDEPEAAARHAVDHEHQLQQRRQFARCSGPDRDCQPQMAIPDEPAVRLGGCRYRSAVFHADCPDGQAASAAGDGRSGRRGAALVHQAGRTKRSFTRFTRKIRRCWCR